MLRVLLRRQACGGGEANKLECGKRMWQHPQENNLQDRGPLHCMERLKHSFNYFSNKS